MLCTLRGAINLASSTTALSCQTHCSRNRPTHPPATWRWLVHPCGRANPRMLARATVSYLGAADAAAAALTAGPFPAGTLVRVGDLGGRGIMATPTAADAMMRVAMMLATVAMTTARPMTAKMLSTARRQR
eukprot:8786712-Pyramimonas_sp.AAC.1